MAAELEDNGGVAMGGRAVDVDCGFCGLRCGVALLCAAGSGGGEGKAEDESVRVLARSKEMYNIEGHGIGRQNEDFGNGEWGLLPMCAVLCCFNLIESACLLSRSSSLL